MPRQKRPAKKSPTSKFPSKKQLRDFIEDTQARDGQATRREIARAFNLKGDDRTKLRQVLKEMAEENIIDLKGKKMQTLGSLPPMAVIDVLSIDDNGDLECFPPNWKEDYAPPAIILSHAAAAKTQPPLGRGDRFLGKLTPLPDGAYEAKPVKVIGQGATRVLGVYRKRRVGGAVEPVSRKVRRDFLVERGDDAKAQDGDLVWAEPKNRRGYGPQLARVREVVGNVEDPASYSLIAIANHDIRTDFPDKVMQEAEAADLPGLAGRDDWRDTPLITIDPADARDHDDAVFAEADTDPKNKGGWRVIVAIADVAYFVPSGSEIDREALKRGNSTYLPDMVVPMLPERLSNDLCSLKENVDRPAMAVEMFFTSDGRKLSHRFRRIMMRSHARLAYREVQDAIDGNLTDRTEPHFKKIIQPLYAAYDALKKAREKRAPLELDLPERKIVFDKNGHVTGVKLKERFDANKLIEEFMIQANVCAAETLEGTKLPLIYRVHGEPDPEKLEGVRQFLEGLDYSLPKGQVIRAKNINGILKLAEDRDEAPLVSQVVLRSQRQAVYDTENIGHFGLNLRRYAHFTSPIRRYADLTVHRALVAACNLGKGAQGEDEAHNLQNIAEEISDHERRSMAAERESVDRFMASWLADRVGAEFAARINGVTRAGIFVTLDDTGADGFVPARNLGHEYFIHVEEANALVGENSRGVYRLGQQVMVKLLEVTPLQGGLLFEMLSEPLEGVKLPDGFSTKRRQFGRGRPGSSHKRKKRKPEQSAPKKPTGKKPKPGNKKPRKKQRKK